MAPLSCVLSNLNTADYVGFCDIMSEINIIFTTGGTHGGNSTKIKIIIMGIVDENLFHTCFYENTFLYYISTFSNILLDILKYYF